MVKAGHFRADLHFRLAVVVITVAPLRQRAEDIPLLARHFAQELSGSDEALTPMLCAGLQSYAWPGNIRELKNAVERVLTLGEGVKPAPVDADVPPTFRNARAQMLQAFEREYLVGLLAQHHGNVSAAARTAGLSRSQLHRLLARHRLVRDDS
jgi:DNA-binding NtrC family response regulator